MEIRDTKTTNSLLIDLAKNSYQDEDPSASSRKTDHITLAKISQVAQTDTRFYYEPVLSGHPNKALEPTQFLGKEMKAPLWISSMTGGTELAYSINRNLAKACQEFGIGMGLGSCRSILFSDDRLEDFNMRPLIGENALLLANLGIAQVEQLVESGETAILEELIHKLQADGLIVHINPLQEWLQPEGDHIKHPPLQTLEELLKLVNFDVIVKEVGQGMGPASLKALFQLPLAAVDFAAHGGTNFAKIELLRSDAEYQALFEPIAKLGHTAEEMVHFSNQVLAELGDKALCKQVIISGGVRSFLDGYYLMNKMQCPAIYGQGFAFLSRAKESYGALQHYVSQQIKGLQLANALLQVR